MQNGLIDKTDFHFPGQAGVYHGKVRDVYDLGDRLLLFSTDKYSAFDRNLALVKNKGQLLTSISKWWFEQTSRIVENHVISYPDQNGVLCKKYNVIPIEMVVRGYITGVTNTSLWHNYSNGQRDFGDFILPDGLKKNDRLPTPVLTPTTKFEEHDRPLTPQEAVSEGLLTQKIWNQLQEIALKLFIFGQKTVESKGLILVDTKYEFGIDDHENIVLIDEIHTPDSSRYWNKETYRQQIDNDEEPDNFDKEYLRLWFKSKFNPYTNKEAPKPPQEILDELRRRYIYVYEQLSGMAFDPREKVLLIDIESDIAKTL